MENIGIALREYFDSQCIRQVDVAKKLGNSKQRISNLLKNGKFGKEEARRWEDAFGISASFLLTGKGEMLVNKDAQPNVQQNKTETAYFYNDLPTTAGDAEQFFSKEQPSGMIKMSGLHGAKYFFPVQGCSMLPRIKNGDWVGVIETDKNSIIDPDKIYMIITRDNQRMIKHITKVDCEKETIVCSSENEQYSPFPVSFNMIISVYQVVCHLEYI